MFYFRIIILINNKVFQKFLYLMCENKIKGKTAKCLNYNKK